jgi:hypothetical protein
VQGGPAAAFFIPGGRRAGGCALAHRIAIRQNGLMRRADFVFCLGYDGSTAIVDGRLQRVHGSLGPRELAEAGLFKQALCAAIFDSDEAARAEILSRYNACTSHPVGTVADLERLYGVSGVPEGVTKVTVI